MLRCEVSSKINGRTYHREPSLDMIYYFQHVFIYLKLYLYSFQKNILISSVEIVEIINTFNFCLKVFGLIIHFSSVCLSSRLFHTWGPRYEIEN